MRLFLALVPPEELRRQLGELADAAHARCGGQRIPNDNLHLTLGFLGEQPEHRARQLADWLSAIRIAPGRWCLDRWGHFAGPGIVWVGGAPQHQLLQLRQSLQQGMPGPALAVQPSRFIPHISLLRQASRPVEPTALDSALDWRYSRAALMLSEPTHQGSRYTALAWSQA